MKSRRRNKTKVGGLVLSTFLILAFPASTHYSIDGYSVGGGGGAGSSNTFSSEGVVGQNAGQGTGNQFTANGGLIYVQEANTPSAPTFQNNGNWYNKLFFVINTSNNPSDTMYALSISSDGGATWQYVQTNNTIGSTFGTSNFQTYAAWGGSSGGYIIGLAQDTSYLLKVKARRGDFTESSWGPTATVSTSPVSLSVDIDVASTDTETSAPYTVAMGSLAVGSVTTATDKIWIDFDTNAANGGQLFIKDLNAGLLSSTRSHTIASSSTDLSTASEGFGIQGNTVTQTSGGPLSFQSPYNGSSENVGVVDTTVRTILSTSSPIVGGRASIYVKAKASASTPASNDYSDVFTVIASGSF